ncbi:MAG: hypothetical protein M1831_002311 [Alyxoria varia]|nr:MAG: hypothetical protein M1831_002311 [Alyxoria varia]
MIPSRNTHHHPRLLQRKDDRVILHFDYDCFYASVVEHEDPTLKSKPLAIQQKQIIVTCNYEARRRGLHKLQLITEAKRLCPDVVIVLGEDLTRFRNASKELYNFLRSFSWGDRVERLGFDEVWLDVTDIVEYNACLLNGHDLQKSFFHLVRDDPLVGFPFDASTCAGDTYSAVRKVRVCDALYDRLSLGSHLAHHMRRLLESEKGYSATVGISTSKLLSKLVGNLHKPNGQTTLLPPYESTEGESNVTSFLDRHDIGSIPGIGFKTAQKLRQHILRRPASFEEGLVYGGTRESVTVAHVRSQPDLGPETLERVLAGPGAPHGIGQKVFALLHGVDNADVSAARDVPRQISLEDSYIKLDALDKVVAELVSLSSRLIERMRIDLVEHTSSSSLQHGEGTPYRVNTIPRRWLARPTTLRLTTRPRSSIQADGQRVRTFQRISRSMPIPSFMLSLTDTTEILADRLVKESLLPLFRKLHPQRGGWDLSLVNVAVTGMSDHSDGGRDIGSMMGDAVAKSDERMGKNTRECGNEIEDKLTVVDQVAESGYQDGDAGDQGNDTVSRELAGDPSHMQDIDLALQASRAARGSLNATVHGSVDDDVPMELAGDSSHIPDIDLASKPIDTTIAYTDGSIYGSMDDDVPWDDAECEREDLPSSSTAEQHTYICEYCKENVPTFAREAHVRWHLAGD